MSVCVDVDDHLPAVLSAEHSKGVFLVQGSEASVSNSKTHMVYVSVFVLYQEIFQHDLNVLVNVVHFHSTTSALWTSRFRLRGCIPISVYANTAQHVCVCVCVCVCWSQRVHLRPCEFLRSGVPQIHFVPQ